MLLEEIKANKKQGDITLAAEMLGLTQTNTAKALENPKSRRHESVLRALEVIIETRKVLKRVTF